MLAEMTPLVEGHASLEALTGGTPHLFRAAPFARTVTTFAATGSVAMPSAAALSAAAHSAPVTRSDGWAAIDFLQFANVRVVSSGEPNRPDAPNRIGASQRAARRAIRAVEDLTSWLSMTEEQVADLAGHTRRSTSNWRLGHGVYQKTVRGLFEIHALVSSLVDRLGPAKAMAWLFQFDEAGLRRIDRLSSAAGRQVVLDNAHDILFASPPRDPASDVPDFVEEESGAVGLSRQHLFREPRVPRHRP